MRQLLSMFREKIEGMTLQQMSKACNGENGGWISPLCVTGGVVVQTESEEGMRKKR